MIGSSKRRQYLQKGKEKEVQVGLLDLRLGSASRGGGLRVKEGDKLLRVKLGVLHQSFPLLRVQTLGSASLHPVDLLAASRYESDGPFDSNLQARLTIGQS